MDYKESAIEVLEKAGGSDNIKAVTHCATRLRLVLNEDGKCNREALEQIDGVKGVFDAAGQLQIIFGAGTVKHVYDEFIVVSGIQTEGNGEYNTEDGGDNLFKRIVKCCKKLFSK